MSSVAEPELAASEKSHSQDPLQEDGQDQPAEAPSDPQGGLPEEEDDEAKYPTGITVILIMISLILAVLTVALDRTILATAIPYITDEFKSINDIGWYGSSYLLTSSSMQLLFGKIYKIYPTKAVFLTSTVIFEVGSAVCGAAPTSTALIIGRSVAGLGASGIFAGGLLVMRDLVPLRKRPLYQGFFGATFGISGVAAPLLGGAFTSKLTWRWCFYINLPLGAFTILVVIFFLRLPKHKDSGLTLKQQFAQLDPLGSLCFIPGTICLLLALQWGGTTYPWNDSRIIVLFVLAGVLLIAFTALQIIQKEENATVPPRIITQRSIAGAAWFSFCTGSAMMLFVYYLPVWFQAIQGVDPVESGIRTLALLLSLTLASITSGLFTFKVGYYNPSMLLCPVVMSIGAGLLTTFTPDAPIGKWIGYQIVCGFGLGLAMQLTGLVAQAVLKRDDVPTGIACMFFFMQLGGAIFVSVGQSVFASALVSNLQPVASLNAGAILKVGATDIREMVPPQYLPSVLDAYNDALMRPFLVALVMSCITIIGAVFVEWVNIKDKRKETKEAEAAEEAAKRKKSEAKEEV